MFDSMTSEGLSRQVSPEPFGFAQDKLRRRNAKPAKKDSLSFRPTGEIFFRSLAFARDDGPWPATLAAFAPLRESWFSRFLRQYSDQNFKHV